MDPNRFWDPEGCENPPLTHAMIAETEQVLGVPLPQALIALLRVQNGGYTRGFVCPASEPTTWAEDHVPVDSLYGIGRKDDPTAAHNILDTAYLTEEWGLPPNQVILTGDGHWWITLDYRNGSNPSVAWIDVEVQQELQLAPSFEAFLAALVPGERGG